MSDHELTQRYYDGELSAADEPVALRHLADCAQCQRELAEWMALDGALADRAAAPAARPAPAPQVVAARPRRWWIAAPVLAAAAAALVIWWAARGRGAPGEPVLALADTRAVEIRVADPRLDRHRPLRVERGGPAGEAIPLATLARLETGAPLTYEGALLLGHDLERARAAIEQQPASPARDADRAGLLLLAGDPAGAIEAADRALAAGPSPVARWNRALALRDLGLTRTAASELHAVAALGEPGWSDEARALADGLRGPIADRDAALTEFNAAETAMLGGGAPIPPELAARFPGQARVDLHDALRAAATADEAGALLAMAEAVDRAGGGDGARRAVASVAGADFAVRRRFAARYRQLLAAQLDPAAVPGFLDELGRAGPAAADIRFGAIVLAGAAEARAAELESLAAATGDPWFQLYIARERARRLRAAGDLGGAEAALRGAAIGCPATVAYRCGALALDLSMLHIESLRLSEAATWAAAARASFVASGTPYLEALVLAHLGDIERLRARFGPMRAYLDEYAADRPDDCARHAFVGQELATAAYWQGDIARTRAMFPEPGACDAPPTPPYVLLAVDLARFTGDAGDLTRARATLERLGDDPESRLIASAGRGRLDVTAADPAAGRALLREAIAASRALPAGNANAAELRTWAYSSLIDDSAARSAFGQALDDFLDELGGPDPGGCLLAVSLDDDRRTSLVRGADGGIRGDHGRTATILRASAGELVPAGLRGALAGCREVAVIARPPLHGRADLLPPSTAWTFLGGSPRPAAGTGGALIVRDAAPPADLRLPRVGATVTEQSGIRVLTGAEATPTKVLAEMATASYVELHVHGLVDLGRADASLLALSPEPDGRFALTAGDLARAKLTAAPIVVLAACRSAEVSPLVNRRWSLPDALLAAGARAVIAAGVPIPDDDAVVFFLAIRRRLLAGESPAAAVAAERSAGTQPWRAHVMVFQ